MKLVPTLHPAGILRAGDWPTIAIVAEDLRRVLAESWTADLTRKATQYVYSSFRADSVAPLLRVGDRRPFYLDIETAGVEDDSPITMCGVGREVGHIACLPFHPPWTDMLAAVLRDPSCPKVAHNSPFDFPRLERALRLEIAGEWWDTAAAWSLLQSDIKNEPGRKVKERNGGDAYCAPLSLLGSLFWDGGFLWKREHKEAALKEEIYCCIDVDVTVRAMQEMEQRLKMQGTWKLARERVFPAVKTCIRMGQRGIRVHRGKMEALREKLLARVDAAMVVVNNIATDLPSRRSTREQLLRECEELERQAKPLMVPGTKREGGKLLTQAKHKRKAIEQLKEVNLSSPKQLASFFYEECRLPEQRLKKRGEEGSITTNDEALVELLRVCGGNPRYEKWRPVVESVRDYREADKAVGTYLSYPSNVLHPQLLVWGTASGRLSCVEPNLQNIPNRKGYAKELRSIYIPMEEGAEFTAVDYSQIERRIQAVRSKDPTLLAAFAEGVDCHKWTAALALEKKMEEVTKEERYLFKRGVYLQSYGGGYMKFQRTLAQEGVYVTPKRAKEILSKISEAHPVYARYAERQTEKATRDHALQNVFGRVRWFHEPKPRGEAINFDPQSTAADIMLRAMNQVEEEVGGLMLQVHDELVVEHNPGERKKVREAMKEIMEREVEELGGWRCPTEAKSGRSLGEMEE